MIGERTDFLSLLLTGNTRAGARAKLGHFGLTDYFIDGAISDDTTDRVTIAHNATKLPNALLDISCLTAACVIGDTSENILCARAVAVPAVAVAAGVYSVEDLEEHDPWWTIAELREPQEIVFALLNGSA